MYRFLLSFIPKAIIMAYLSHESPLRGIIAYDDANRMMVNGRRVSPDQLLTLRDSAQNALDNGALKLIREQVRFNALNQGYLQNTDPSKDAGFYKSVLWYAQEEINILQALAGTYTQALDES